MNIAGGHPGKEWMKIDTLTGKIIHCDWDFAEKLAQAHRDGVRQDIETAFAVTILAVREYVLEIKVQEWQKEPKL